RHPYTVGLLRCIPRGGARKDHGRLDSILGFLPNLGEKLRVKFLERLGIVSLSADEDADTVGAAFDFLEASAIGYDRFFFDWHGGSASEGRALRGSSGEHYQGEAFTAFRTALDRHAPVNRDLLETPYFKGESPCSLLIEEIEDIWRAIDTRDDWAPFETKIKAIREMGALLSGQG
ncbi:MAG: protein adenylyltransferase SelO family protein, partial [Polyangiaceae bacterium]